MAAQNVKDMPLRAVVGREADDRGWMLERLECGHLDRPRTTGLGYATTAKRRRCWQCLRCRQCGEAIYAHDTLMRKSDAFWHGECAVGTDAS